MNLGDLRTRLSFLVDFNEGQADQDFIGPSTDSNRHLDFFLNEAYREEVNLGKQNGSRDAFKKKFDITWPRDQQLFTIPIPLLHGDILAIQDNSEITPGPIIPLFDELVEGSGLYIHDHETWGLRPAPGADRSLTILFLARPNVLKQDGDKPDLIHDDHQDLLIWSAGVLARIIADEQPPSMWLQKQHTLRLIWWKKLAQGTPMLHPPKRIRNENPDVTELF